LRPRDKLRSEERHTAKLALDTDLQARDSEIKDLQALVARQNTKLSAAQAAHAEILHIALSGTWKHLFPHRQRFQRIEWSVAGASNECGGFTRFAVSADADGHYCRSEHA
jgi:hypothetical protein